jgi:lipopolysaccharide export system permease protein
MRLLQRYILVELLKVFACLLTGLTFLLVFVGVFREVSENGLGPLQIVQILPYLVPSLMPYTMPATFLLTVCVVYGRLAGDNEITAAKAAGINVMSLLFPAILMGGVLSVTSFLLADRVIPWSIANIQRVVTNAMEDIFLDVLRTRHVIQDPDRGYSIGVMGVKGKQLLFPTFQYAPKGRSPVMVQAESAMLEFDLEDEQVILHLVRADIQTAGQDTISAENYSHSLPMPQEIKKAKPRHRSIVDILRNAHELRFNLKQAHQQRDVSVALALAEGNFEALTKPELNISSPVYEAKWDELAKLRTEIHGRFSLSSSCLLFTLLGGPFSIVRGRRQFLTNFFLCFLPILMLYYPIVLLMMNLSKTGDVNPSWAMWIGNVVLLVVAGSILRKVLKH